MAHLDVAGLLGAAGGDAVQGGRGPTWQSFGVDADTVTLYSVVYFGFIYSAREGMSTGSKVSTPRARRARVADLCGASASSRKSVSYTVRATRPQIAPFGRRALQEEATRIFKPEPTRLTRFIPTRRRRLHAAAQDILGVVPRPVHRRCCSSSTTTCRRRRRGRRQSRLACLLNLYAFLCVANSNPRAPAAATPTRSRRISTGSRTEEVQRETTIEEGDEDDDDEAGGATEAEIVADGEAGDVSAGSSSGGDLESGRRRRRASDAARTREPGGCWAPRAARATPATSRPRPRRVSSAPTTANPWWASTANTARRGGGCARSTATTAAGACAQVRPPLLLGGNVRRGEESRAVRVVPPSRKPRCCLGVSHISNSAWKYADTFHGLFEINAGQCACPSRSSSSSCSSVRCWASTCTSSSPTRRRGRLARGQDQLPGGCPGSGALFPTGRCGTPGSFAARPRRPEHAAIVRVDEGVVRTETIWENKYYVCC